MAYIYYDTPNGKAFFQDTSSGFAAVSDPTLLKKLRSGQIQATAKSVNDTAGMKFSHTPAGYKPLPDAQSPKPLPDLKTTNEPSLPTRSPFDFSNFAAALNEAVSLAREQRQSKELDYLGKVIPKGAVSAGTFTSLLSNLNTASNKYSESLTDAAFKQIDAQNDIIKQEQESIRDLALAALENGASADEIKSIMNTGDITAAMGVAAGVLKGKMKDADIRQLGDKLVVLEEDENGNMVPRLLFDGSPGGGDDGIKEPEVSLQQYINAAEQELQQTLDPSNPIYKDLEAQWKQDFPTTGTSKFTDTELRKLEQAGLLNASRQEQLDFLYKEEEDDTDIPESWLPKNEQ